jgi:hypothetical protein
MTQFHRIPDRCRDPECGIGLVAHTTDPVPAGFAVHAGRGLCKACYGRARRTPGGLDAYPPMSLSAHEMLERAHEVLEQWTVLRAGGHTLRSAAAKMGMSTWGLRTTLARAGAGPIPRLSPTGWAEADLFDPYLHDEGEGP